MHFKSTGRVTEKTPYPIQYQVLCPIQVQTVKQILKKQKAQNKLSYKITSFDHISFSRGKLQKTSITMKVVYFIRQ